MSAYYNENDPEMVAWLRELISRGLLPAGDVDDRSILDVAPDDLRPFTQCHFFAGIGGWPASLTWIANWPTDRPVWTGSCPCQPFSQAGEGKGFDDERHLWPAWFHLIRVCRPVEVYGEQVSNSLEWLDLVQDDMEGEDYAVEAAILTAASVGAPHIRERLFWSAHSGEYLSARMAHAKGQGFPCGAGYSDSSSSEKRWQILTDHGTPDGMGHAIGEGSQGYAWYGDRAGWASTLGPNTSPSIFDELADAYRPIPQLAERERARPDDPKGSGSDGEFDGCGELPVGRIGTGTCHGFWRNSDWLLGRDERFRPVEAGSFPLADGIPERVVRLRGYGNAIVPQAAAAYVAANQQGLNDVYRCYNTGL